MQLAANTQSTKRTRRRKKELRRAKDRLEKTAFPIYENIGK